MKTTSTKNNHTSNSHTSKPFFTKSGKGSFFFQSKETREPFFSPYPIQTKLTIGQPNDKYEQEADSMSEKVVQNMNSTNSSAIVQNKCEDCTQEEKLQEKEGDGKGVHPKEMDKEETLQTKPLMRKAADGGSTASPLLASQLNSNKGRGKSLSGQPLADMNQAFGSDFSNVRVHTNSQAAEMSQGIQAKAFTHGSDIYFNQGQYNPQSSEGKRLLAHELTHVDQQTGMIQKDELDSGSAMGKSYIVPTIGIGSTAANTNTVQVSPGEKMIFRIVGTDRDKRRTSAASPWVESDGTGPYEINFSIAGDAELDSSGSGTIAKRIVGLNTGNVFIFVKGTWNQTSAITITVTLTDNATAATAPDTGTLKDPDKVFTWNLIKRANSTPTSLNKIAGPGAVWSAAPATYTYQAMPHIASMLRPNYQGQIVLERFGTITALGFTMSDLTDYWKLTNPSQNTPDKVARFIWNTGGNSSFVFNSSDLISDRHGGFGTKTPFKASAFTDADGVGYRLPQEYVVGSTVIGTATIDRRHTTALGTQIKKTGP